MEQLDQTHRLLPQRDWNDNVLHVYPRTFNEVRGNGERWRGIGSIAGITEKLDWMSKTGVTAVWLGPIYESPGCDGNYDISNYRAINPEIGTMSDVETLIAAAHERDIRVIFDLVPNHTSDQHEWFEASRDPQHSLHEMYRDYYIWHDPISGELPLNIVGDNRLEHLPSGVTVPNNWSSIFSLPQIEKARQLGMDPADIPAVTAWVWSEMRQQFYLAEFMKEQPSLNWQNPAVREEMKDVVRFWLDKGVDSFRVDVMNHIGKDPTFANETRSNDGTYEAGVSNPHDQWKQEKLVSHWPQLGEYVRELLSVVDEPAYEDRDIRLVFEDWMSALSGDERLNRLRPEVANVFNFETLLNTNRREWNARNIGRVVQRYYTSMNELPDAVPNQVTGNHDTDTLRTRLGSAMAARAAQLMLGSLPGALYVWQGDVMGRVNVLVPQDRQQDGDIGMRDGARIPLQWNASKNGGFSQAEPSELWLPAVDKAIYEADNLEAQARDPKSPYNLTRELFRQRRNDPALHAGETRILHADHANVLAFARSDPLDPRRQVTSVTNFTTDTTSVHLHDALHSSGVVSLTSSRHGEGESVDFTKPIVLSPEESYVIISR